MITIFPDWFEGPLGSSLLGKAREDDTLDVRLHDLRDWTDDRHRSVDDSPYGGGAGMVMRADVWFKAATAIWNDVSPAPATPYAPGGDRPRTILLTPRGTPFTQELARDLAAEDRLVFCCGRYEGIDERVHEAVATDEISIGDYVLLGGEVAAAAVIEAVARLLPGVVGNEASPADESFSDGLLEYPHYTRPPELEGMAVPEVLLSGNHAQIEQWRRDQAQELTRRRRPDL